MHIIILYVYVFSMNMSSSRGHIEKYFCIRLILSRNNVNIFIYQRILITNKLF